MSLTKKPFKKLYYNKTDKLVEKLIHHLYRAIDCAKALREYENKKDNSDGRNTDTNSE